MTSPKRPPIRNPFRLKPPESGKPDAWVMDLIAYWQRLCMPSMVEAMRFYRNELLLAAPRGPGPCVLVCGPRDGTGQSIVNKAMDAAVKTLPEFGWVVTGSRRGTDLEAWNWCMERERPCLIVPALWETGAVGGKPEGMIRNRFMYQWARPSYVLGFPSPGTGTAGMITHSCKDDAPSYWWKENTWQLDPRVQQAPSTKNWIG